VINDGEESIALTRAEISKLTTVYFED